MTTATTESAPNLTVMPVVRRDDLDLWAEQASTDLIGAVLQAPGFGHHVAGLLDLDDLAPRSRRLLAAAHSVEAVSAVDLSVLDDGDGVGPHLLINGQLIIERPLLSRLLKVAAITEEPVVTLATMVISIPCAPCPNCVEKMVAEVRQAAESRRALLVVEELRRLVAQADHDAVATVLNLAADGVSEFGAMQSTGHPSEDHWGAA